MDVDLVNKIKRLTIIALASDDELIETIVLKGGNAIDLAYNNGLNRISRTSYDLDFSIENGDFENDEEISERISKSLTQTFGENGLVVIDYKFINRPRNVRDELSKFWGGYKVTFKVLKKDIYELNSQNIGAQRRLAVPIKPDHSPTFELEFSKFEYVGDKKKIDVGGYNIYVYTAEMIVFEKVRAICQQLPGYAEVIPSFSPRARARDFYDIHYIMENFEVKPNKKENVELLKQIFDAKKVPLSFLKEIRNNKSIHSQDWESVKDTVSISEKLKEFDFYFDYVLENFEDYIPLG